MKEQITVTSPLLPDLKEYNQLLQDIWSRKSNMLDIIWVVMNIMKDKNE